MVLNSRPKFPKYDLTIDLPSIIFLHFWPAKRPKGKPDVFQMSSRSWPQYFPRPARSGSRGPSEFVRTLLTARDFSLIPNLLAARNEGETAVF